MKRKVEKPPTEFVARWWCKICWQVGAITFQDQPPLGWPDPAQIPAVIAQHKAILANFEGPKGKCPGQILPLGSKSVMKRIKVMTPPALPDEGDPIIITKRGTE